jgi:hypothetical protein
MNEEWLNQNYEKAALIAATVVAVGLCGWLFYSSTKFQDIFSESSGKQSDKFPETGLVDVDQAIKNLDSPVVWEGEHLFVSSPVLEVFEGEVPKLEPVTVGSGGIHAPVTNAWIMKWKLDITDGNLKGADPDGDNFTNLEEFDGGTNPNNAESHPPFIAKVCLREVVSSDLTLIFRTKVDSRTWQIDLSSEGKFKSRNMLVSMGSKFGPDNRFKLEKYIEKKLVDAGGVPRDESEVIVSYYEAGSANQETVSLSVNSGWEMPTHTGLFVNRYNGEEFEVKRGDSFRLSNDQDNSFTLVAVTDSGGIIKDQRGKDRKLGPCE